MMPRTISILIFLFSFSTANSQSSYYVDNKYNFYRCPDVATKSSGDFIELMQKRNYDSAEVVLNNWERVCGIREVIFRSRVMLAIAIDGNADTLFTDPRLSSIYRYEDRAEMIRTKNYINYDYSPPSYGFIPIGQEFDSYSISFFSEYLNNTDSGTINHLLCEFYSNELESIFVKLQNSEFRNSNLFHYYDKRVKHYVNMPELHGALLAGIWIPTGGISQLGSHPRIGIQAGTKFRKINIDLTVSFKFLKSANNYYARRVSSDDSVVLTDNFFGAYLGIDGGYDIWKKRNNEVQLLFGGGVDGFDVIEADTVRNIKPESILTYNFNLGVGYRFYVSETTYIGLNVKYNIVNYALRNIIDFKGNPVTLTFSFGGLSNNSKKRNLEYLHYNLRQ